MVEREKMYHSSLAPSSAMTRPSEIVLSRIDSAYRTLEEANAIINEKLSCVMMEMPRDEGASGKRDSMPSLFEDMMNRLDEVNYVAREVLRKVESVNI